jgi:hypothetical protein
VDAPSKPSPLLRAAWLAVRVVALLLLCITAGVATSYAVAWNAVLQAGTIPPVSFSLSQDRPFVDDGYRLSASGFMFAEIYSGSAGDRVQVDPSTPDTWWKSAITDPFPRVFGGKSLAEIIDAIPDAPKATVFRDANYFSPFQAAITSAGWPFPCLRYVSVNDFSRVIRDPSLPRTLLGGRINLSTDLPIRPLWPGLAWNTLIFATAWFFLGWSTLFAARRLRRLHRSHHNRCPACGYSLAGVTADICPECGKSSSNTTQARTS